MPERGQDGDQVEERRELSLPVGADRPSQHRVGTLRRDDRPLQDQVGDRRQQQHQPVARGRHRREVVLAHPPGDERHQRQPEQEVEVRPQHRPGDAVSGMQHVMVVVPVDAEVEEAQHVAQEERHQGRERLERVAVGNAQLEHHDRDDDRDHAVAERFEPGLRHPGRVTSGKRRPARSSRGHRPHHRAVGQDHGSKSQARMRSSDRRAALRSRMPSRINRCGPKRSVAPTSGERCGPGSRARSTLNTRSVSTRVRLARWRNAISFMNGAPSTSSMATSSGHPGGGSPRERGRSGDPCASPAGPGTAARSGRCPGRRRGTDDGPCWSDQPPHLAELLEQVRRSASSSTGEWSIKRDRRSA